MSRRGGGGSDRDRNEITKNIKQGIVEIDYEESSLIVHYEVEMIEVDERGATVAILDTKPEIRRIKIRNLSPDRNMAQLAADIVDKCKYIHPSRTEEIEQLLIKLRRYNLANASVPTSNAIPTPNTVPGRIGGGVAAQAAPNYGNYQDPDINNNVLEDNFMTNGRRSEGKTRTASNGNRQRPDINPSSVVPTSGGDRGGNDDYYYDRENGRDHNNSNSNNRRGGGGGNGRGGNDDRSGQVSKADQLPPADMSQLDEYLEMLYQVSGKTEKEREEGLRMQEKGTAMILKLCRDVMNLEQLIQNSTVMGAVTRVLQEEYKKSMDLTYNILRIFLAFSNFLEMHSLMANYKIGVLTMKAIDFEIKRIELRESERQEREAELQLELQKAKEDNVGGGGNLLDYPKLLERHKKIREKEKQKNTQFLIKQQKIFLIGFYILLNLAEDITVERKMIKKGLIQQLIAIISSPNFTSAELIELVLRFLKKLSIYEENKETFKEEGKIIPLLYKYITCSCEVVIKMTLRVLFNLSFDKECRELMLKHGYIPKLVNLLNVPKHRAKVLKLLYHLSVDDRCKSMITYTDAVPLLMTFVIRIPEERLPGELAALMINLSYYPKNCELMIQNLGLNLLMDRFHDKRDPLVMKIIRNISLWTFNQQQELDAPELSYKYRALWTPHIKILIDIMLESDNHDLIVEIVGCLANMTVYDLPATSNWSKLLREYNLMNYFTKLLVPGMAQNDLVLEIIMLIATIATDAAACSILATGNLITTLYQIFKEKTDDSEITLQLLNCFHKLLYPQTSREVVMYSTRIFSDIIECLSHRNSAIRTKAEKMSEFVYENDRKPDGEIGPMARSIIKKRFENYNRAWLNTVFGSSAPSTAPSSFNSNGVNNSNGSLYGDGITGPGSYDRLPTSQEMMNSAKYLQDKVDSSLDWQFHGSNKAHFNPQDISKLDDDEDVDETDELDRPHHDDSYDFNHMQQTQSEIDSWSRGAYGGGGGYYK